MAKSTFTLAAPPGDEEADAFLSTKKLIKPKKSGSIKGVLAGAAAVSFALVRSRPRGHDGIVADGMADLAGVVRDRRGRPRE